MTSLSSDVYSEKTTNGTQGKGTVQVFFTPVTGLAFYRATHPMDASAVLAVVILSVHLSHACFVITPNNALRIFWYHTKGNRSSFLIPTVVGGRRLLPSEISAQSDPLPSKNADFNRFPLVTSQP